MRSGEDEHGNADWRGETLVTPLTPDLVKAFWDALPPCARPTVPENPAHAPISEAKRKALELARLRQLEQQWVDGKPRG